MSGVLANSSNGLKSRLWKTSVFPLVFSFPRILKGTCQLVQIKTEFRGDRTPESRWCRRHDSAVFIQAVAWRAAVLWSHERHTAKAHGAFRKDLTKEMREDLKLSSVDMNGLLICYSSLQKPVTFTSLVWSQTRVSGTHKEIFSGMFMMLCNVQWQ